MKINELYKSVTDQIVRELENGTIPWIKPWSSSKASGVGFMPTNAATGRSYRGINIFILWDKAERMGFKTHAWLTFKQAKDLGGCVRKGEKGTNVVFTKKIHVKDEGSEEEGKTKLIPLLKTYTVFNVAQVDGLEKTFKPTPPPNTPIEEFFEATGADIHYGGGACCYVPSQDFIQMTPYELFKSEEHFHATKAHELVHWTGAKHRLDRDLSGRFGTKSYAAEELIAELGAAFLCAHLGITGDLRHASYIGDWLTLLKEDDRAIFTAASKASQAADFIRSFTEDMDEVHDAIL